ncbi:MAG: hypothetical protein CMJ58_28715 [Planctomycetaceae bacterium]|nr:hypothetical protein [Planctomycetaceae bacterium]
MIRFHLDQHVDSAIARGLRRRGVDVTTAAEAGLQDAADEQHVSYALREGRVIFTRDADFVAFHEQGVAHAGIVYSKQGRRSVGEVVNFLDLLSQCMEPDDMQGRVEYF